MTLIAAGLGFIIKEQREKIKIIQNQLSDKKYTVYNEIFAVFFDLIKDQKGMSDKKGKDTATRLFDIKKDLLIYAPDKIAKKFFEWNRAIPNEGNSIRHVKIYLELFVLIRKDMGHADSTITENDILRGIMASDEAYEEIKRRIEQ